MHYICIIISITSELLILENHNSENEEYVIRDAKK